MTQPRASFVAPTAPLSVAAPLSSFGCLSTTNHRSSHCCNSFTHMPDDRQRCFVRFLASDDRGRTGLSSIFDLANLGLDPRLANEFLASAIVHDAMSTACIHPYGDTYIDVHLHVHHLDRCT